MSPSVMLMTMTLTMTMTMTTMTTMMTMMMTHPLLLRQHHSPPLTRHHLA
jgi:hypothetical protein